MRENETECHLDNVFERSSMHRRSEFNEIGVLYLLQNKPPKVAQKANMTVEIFVRLYVF